MAGENLILGIDPGSRATGYGVIGSLEGGRGISFVADGVIRTNTRMNFTSRLKTLYDGIEAVISEFNPEVVAVEEVFVSRNARAALKLGHARAAVIMAALNQGLPVYEYTPLEIKKAVAGYGRAEKGQVQKMVSIILNLSRVPPKDASDALAVAVCHVHSQRVNKLMEIRIR